jgi:hypothetical protein
MVSISLIIYFIVDLFTTTNPCKGALDEQQQQTAEDIYPSPEANTVNNFPEESANEDIDFRSFDIDQKNTLGSDKSSVSSNFWEYSLNLITPLILVALLYAQGTSAILLSLLFLLSLFIICYQSSSREVGNQGTSDTLSMISRLKSFSSTCRLIYMGVLLLFWAVIRRGDLMTTQIFSTIAVFFVVLDIIIRFAILAIRTMTAADNIKKEEQYRLNSDQHVRATEVERLDSVHSSRMNSSGLVSDRNNPYASPRVHKVRVSKPYTEYNNPIVISSPRRSPSRVVVRSNNVFNS